MRHRVAHRKLGRKTEHRLALLRNLCTSLITHERLITTLPKAKELRPFAERAITLGKRALTAEAPEGALHKRRLAAAYFFTGNTNRVPDGGYKRPQAPRTAGVCQARCSRVAMVSRRQGAAVRSSAMRTAA